MLRTGLFLTLVIFLLAALPLPAFSKNDTTASPLLDPYSIIQLVNNQRTANGLPALVVNSILMQTAQTTAETMAANEMHGHIGDVRGRVAAAGYGSGATVWATENFVAVRPGGESAIASMWADAAHQLPMVEPNYKNVGAGAASSPNGLYYYVLHAAYTSGGQVSNAAATPTGGAKDEAEKPTTATVTLPASEYIYGVVTVTPQADGRLVHTIQQGQSLWSIAIAYHTKIVEILRLNNLPQTNPPVFIGQKLIIPTSSEIPPTPTPTITSTPEPPTETPTLGPPPPTEIPTITPTPVPTPLIPQSVLPNVIVGLIVSFGGILALYGILGKRR